MRKTIFLSILLISLTSCSINLDEETDKKTEPINNNPSCATLRDNQLYCVWWNGTCKAMTLFVDSEEKFGWNQSWRDCWNALK